MAEKAVTDPNPKVRAAAACALGPMKAMSSVPKLKAILNDKEPALFLQPSTHSYFWETVRRCTT